LPNVIAWAVPPEGPFNDRSHSLADPLPAGGTGHMSNLEVRERWANRRRSIRRRGNREMMKHNFGKASAFLLSGALLLSVAALSVATGPSVGASSTSSTSNTITISNFMFKPMVLTVSPGATVKVVNKDTTVHTVEATGGQFNTGNILPGKTKSFKAPKKPGKYHYICAIHTFMKGTIVVK
jgi:plastocyanin